MTEIWGNSIPFNTGKSKLSDMTVKKMPEIVLLLGMAMDTFGTKIVKSTKIFDTFTYEKNIKPGYGKATYDDVPTITPYLSDGSDIGVVIAPGGGFFYKEMEAEGHARARLMNQMGISAFVLDYRINPYKFPAAAMDMQRAVRYVRAHAAEYGVDPNKVGVIGSSAGGYVAASSALLLPNEAPDVDGYIPDAIDRENGMPSFIALFYPVTGFLKNPSMLSLLVGKDFFDEEKRPALQEQFSLQNHLDGNVPPVFLARGDKDPLKDMLDFERAMQEKKLPIEVLTIPKAGHGFSPIKNAESLWMKPFETWCKGSF